MRSLSKLIVIAANLIEAEGRLAKHHAFRFVAAVLALVVAAVFVVLGVIAGVAGLYAALAEVAHPAVGLVVIAALLLAASIASCAAAKVMSEHRGA